MTERLDSEIFGDDEEQRFDLTIRDTTQLLGMAVQITSGELDVEVTDDDETMTVTVTPDRGRGSDPVARVSWDGQRLEIHPVKAAGLTRVLRGSGSYDVMILIPRRQMTTSGGAGVSARLSTASGEVRVAGLTGDVRVDAASGDLSVSRVVGQLECRAASGDIQVEEFHGRARLTATSGDVSLSESVVERLTLNSVSGDANVDAIPVGHGAIEVATVSGGVNVELALAPESGRFALDVQTLSGSVDVEGAAERRGRRSWRLGDGPGNERPFQVRTVSGDVSIEVGDGELPDDLPDLPAETASDGKRKSSAKTDGHSGGKSDWQRIVGEVEAELGDVLADLGRHRTPPVPPVPPVPPASPVVPVPPVSPVPPTPPVSPSADALEADRERSEQKREVVDGEYERLEILRGLEEGRIDVEEAMTRLDRLGSPGD
ncbi:MAG TPA: DUF4097 family beta strand repeat-containing protein [Thermomicrobiales bacterium]|jgi:DUF4097 and DUF4098 domain-containing protein YvlB|nr:DUF4097 family beta strand repeat-containing protein [Thermomicrobiales bacterium]